MKKKITMIIAIALHKMFLKNKNQKDPWVEYVH